MAPRRSRRATEEHQQRPVAELAQRLEEIGGTPIDVALLQRALTHRSYSYEHGAVPHNERQEFLGDSVLGIVVTEWLFHDHPEMAEGQLAKLRASVVNSRALAEVARAWDLGDYVMLGRGEDLTGGRDKISILADTAEAVIGTVYLSGGLEASRRVVHHALVDLMARATASSHGLDWKTSLQEAAAAAALGAPSYQITDSGPDHDKSFTAQVLLGSEILGVGNGSNKKSAEQQDAEQAWHEMQRRADSPSDADAVSAGSDSDSSPST